MANFNFNKVILGGRLTSDPELKTTQSGISVTSFTVAVNRRFGSRSGEEAQADFISCTAWRQQAEFITRYFRKASSITVVGSLQTRNWTDANGQKHYVTEVVVDEAYFVDSKGENAGVGQSNAFANVQAQPFVPESYGTPAFATSVASPDAPKFEEITDDDDLPF